MRKTQVIQARTEPKVKKEVEKIFSQVGLNVSEAVNLFFHQVILHKGIPFEIKIPNLETRKAMKQAKSKKGLRSFEAFRV